MTQQVLAGKIGVVFGVANKRSIAWAIAKAWAAAGARLIFNYQGERLKENVEELVGEFGEQTSLFPCDVSSDDEIQRFFKQLRGQGESGSHGALSRLRSRAEKNSRELHFCRTSKHLGRARNQRIFVHAEA